MDLKIKKYPDIDKKRDWERRHRNDVERAFWMLYQL
jgi:hypothetical protein